MKRVLILIISIFTSWNIAEAQEAYQQAESFNRLAKEAFTRVEKHSNRDSVAIFKAVVDGVEYSLKSDEFDRMPNRKGKLIQSLKRKIKNDLLFCIQC